MNILLMTTVYPRDDASKVTTATKVIHYFAAEWKKQGHNVMVINNVNRLPMLIYYFPRVLRDIVKTKTGYEIPDVKMTKQRDYEYEGISVVRLPIFKAIPRGVHSTFRIRKHCYKIEKILKDKKFVPDVIIGHWASPHVQILSELKKKFPCKNAIVLHDLHYIVNDQYGINSSFENIDYVGCRSKTMALQTKDILKLDKLPFVCCSGIPDAYVEQAKYLEEKNREPITKFIYVGELIKRKNVDTVIQALALKKDIPWQLDIVGIGGELTNLKELAQKLAVEDRIIFHGRVSRDKVMELTQNAHCFTMVSKGEAFGLVYLEAMLSSCITVGSRAEGIDGIIVDRQNGYLCEAGNVEELSNIYNEIFVLSDSERQRVVKEAYLTACNYTDSICAKKYLEYIE